MNAFLLIQGPDTWLYHFPLEPDQTVRIGRGPECELRLQDPSVSAKHAILFHERGRWKIQDNLSRNGTYVNGVMVKEAALQPDHEIQIGHTKMTFCLAEEGDEEDLREKTLSALSEQTGGALGADEPPPATPETEAMEKRPEPEKPPRRAASRPWPAEGIKTPLPADVAAPEAAPGAPPDSQEPPPVQPFSSQVDTSRGSTTMPSSTDMLRWVTGHLSDLMREIATMRGFTSQALYTRVLQKAREIIQADNGFLMLVDHANKKWVIRAWVGDSSSWTAYEKEHPLPLTIARQAFREDRVVSNALSEPGSGEPGSESLFMLNVHCYIAAPIHHEGEARGLLYFDTRKSYRTFTPRDVRLLQAIGDFILRVEQGR